MQQPNTFKQNHIKNSHGKAEEIQALMKTLSPEERSTIEALLADLKAGKKESSLLDKLRESEYLRPMVDIETFVKDPYYLGATCGDIYPVLLEDLKELEKGNYEEAIWCLHPDTVIAGYCHKKTIKELADEWERGEYDRSELPVFSIDTKNKNSLMLTSAVYPHKTGEDDYYKLTLDNGTYVQCNARHQFLNRDGQYVMLKNMKIGDALMPFNIIRGGPFGEDLIYNPNTQAWTTYVNLLPKKFEGYITKKEEKAPYIVRYVKNIEKTGHGPVYCMTVPKAGNFAIFTRNEDDSINEDGLISSNTGSTRIGKCARPTTEIYDPINGVRRTYGDIGEHSVVSLNEKTYSLEKAAATSFASGQKLCVKITFTNGEILELSTDHPILTQRGWVEAAKLTTEDFIAAPRFLPAPEKPYEISDEEIKILAYMMADGSCTNSLTFTNETPVIIDELRTCVKTIGIKYNNRAGIEPDVKLKKCQNHSDIDYSVTGISHLLNKYNLRKKSIEKRLPAELYGLSNRQIALFLNRFWACDGSVYSIKSKTKIIPRLEVTLGSELMIKDIRFLLLRLGIYSRTYAKTKFYTYNRVRRSKKAWALFVTGQENIKKFFDKVGFILSKESACLRIMDHYAKGVKEASNVDVVPFTGKDLVWVIKNELTKEQIKIARNFEVPKSSRFATNRFKLFCKAINYKGKFSYLADTDVFWERVKTIEETGVQDVYDVSVPGNHNLVANNIIIHNTFISSIVVCRFLYRLSCMRDPQRSLGISAGSKIACIVLSANEMLAQEVAFDNILTKLTQSPYFKDHFPFKDNKGELIFPNNIVVVAKATTDRSALGFNIGLFWLDEAAFFGNNKKIDPKFGHVDNAEVIYLSLKTRMKNTFKKSKFKGVAIISSSKGSVDDFIARHTTQIQNNPNVFYADRCAWSVTPELYENSKWFNVLIGNELMASRLISDEELVQFNNNLPDGAFIIQVPEEFKPDFEQNLERSIQDLAGFGTTTVSPFIQQRDRIIDAYDTSKWPSYLKTVAGTPLLQHNFITTEWNPSQPGGFVWDRMVSKKLVREYDGSYIESYKPFINASASRAVHIDPSLRQDSTGFAMAHIAGFKNVQRRDENGVVYSERAPIYVVDLVLRIVPPVGGEIEFAKVRDLVYQLSNHGYHIGTVSMDKYIKDGLQPFKQKGYSTEWISLDETTEPYDVFKSALYEGRIYFYKYDRLIQELQLLEKHYEGKRIKIDHNPNFSKDLCDAVAGAIFSLSTKQNLSPLPLLRTSNTAEDSYLQEHLDIASIAKEKEKEVQDPLFSYFINSSWESESEIWSNL